VKIIILSQSSDLHGSAVHSALDQAGYQAVFWAGLAWTQEQQASLRLGHETRLMLGPYAVEPGDVVWIRRPQPAEPNPEVSEADKKFAGNEYGAFYKCIAYLLELLPVRCINPYSRSRFIDNKAVQLHLAGSCGLNVPAALMSNAPTAVRSFLGRGANRTICKPFVPNCWQRKGGGGAAVTYSFELIRKQLPESKVLTYAPSIYQDLVVKEFDVRTLLMGNEVYSFSLRTPQRVLDWRQDCAQGKIEVQPIKTPSEVESALLAFAQRAGLCFGSADFAVDFNGRWWFLEINEQGQFLWLDNLNSTAGTLEKFCAFLTMPEESPLTLDERAQLFPSFSEYQKFMERAGPFSIPSAPRDNPFVSREP
jgi:glutathione synthase/RimK-type ligase-like ATP-grasp enzyme